MSLQSPAAYHVVPKAPHLADSGLVFLFEHCAWGRAGVLAARFLAQQPVDHLGRKRGILQREPALLHVLEHGRQLFCVEPAGDVGRVGRDVGGPLGIVVPFDDAYFELEPARRPQHLGLGVQGQVGAIARAQTAHPLMPGNQMSRRGVPHDAGNVAIHV